MAAADIDKVAVDKAAVAEFFRFCDDNEVEFIDFRFSDIKGVWHHVSFSRSAIDESSFQGLPFDGSSIPAWQSVDKSDMMLIPDPVRYFIDPFTADTTAVVFCDIWDIYKNEPYEKCPRSYRKKGDEVFTREWDWRCGLLWTGE